MTRSIYRPRTPSDALLAMKHERDDLMLENKRLRDCLSQLVKDIDAWEAIVATAEGREPDARWGNLDEARRLLR